MGNQQATLPTEDLAWLAGFADGDGCFSMHRRERSGGRRNYKPEAVFSNNDREIIDAVASVLQSVQVGHWIVWQKPTPGRLGKSMRGSVEVKGFKRLYKLLPLLLPYLRGKRAEADLLYQWIDRRMSVGHSNGARITYGPEDDRAYEQLAAMKRSKGAPETIRGGRWSSEEDDGKI